MKIIHIIVKLSLVARYNGKGVQIFAIEAIMEQDELLTLKQAKAYLKVSRSTLYRLVNSKQLVGHKVGSSWRFLRSDLAACVKRVAA